MMENEWKKFIPAFIGVCHFGFTFINDRVIFGLESSEAFNISIPFYVFCKLLTAILLLWFWKFIFGIDNTNRIKIFLIYFILMLILIICCWPGVWRWDELITLGHVSNGIPYYWQHWLSSVYTFVALEIIPIPGGIILIQAFVICLIVEEIIWGFYRNLRTKFVFLAYIPLCLPAVLDSNMYPIRATVCAYIELWVVSQMIYILVYDEKCDIKRIMQLAIVGGLLTAWRPENIIYIVIIPLAMFWTKKVAYKKIFMGL